MNKKIIFLLTILFLIVITSCFSGDNKEAVKETVLKDLSAQDFMDKIGTMESLYKVIDVRTPGEFNTGKIKDALNINLNSPDFKSRIDKLDRDSAYFLYCRSGNRSGQAGKIMNEMGFREVYNLKGGVITDTHILQLER